ncbi:hypothetical protein [Micromonospora sp. NBC_00617]
MNTSRVLGSYGQVDILPDVLTAPPATLAGRWCSRCRVGVQLVGVLIPR